MNEFVNNEGFTFLIVEVVNGSWYAFDMAIEKEKEIADDIVRENWQYTTIEDYIIGWKVATVRPLRSKDAAAWSKFVYSFENANVNNDNNDFENDYQKEEDDSFEDDEGIFGRLGQDVYESNDIKYSGKHSQFSHNNDDSGEEDNKFQQHTYIGKRGTVAKKKYYNKDFTLKTEESKYESEDENLNSLQIDDISKITPADMGTSNVWGNSKINNDKMLENMFGGDFKANIANSIKTTSTAKNIEVYVTGPFRKEKTGKSYYVLVFADMRKAFFIKSEFLRGYVGYCLKALNVSNVDTDYSQTFDDINIRKKEFGSESEWKRTKQNKTISTISFVMSCATTKEKQIGQILKQSLDLLFKIMEKRNNNPIGTSIVDYLEENQSGLYKYLLKKGQQNEMSEEDAGTMLTNDTHEHFKCGYTLKFGDSLNRFMVDYDIVRILSQYIGYSSWGDMNKSNLKKCFRDYDNLFELPDWGSIQQERY